jgi:hypothetical protein
MSEPGPIRTFFPRRGVLGALAGATATLALPIGAAQAESASRTAAVVAEGDNPDHALFGVWDAASGMWSRPARIDYAAAPTLAPVEQAVKAGGTPPPYTSVLYPDTRVAVLRDGWRPDASYLRTTHHHRVRYDGRDRRQGPSPSLPGVVRHLLHQRGLRRHTHVE